MSSQTRRERAEAAFLQGYNCAQSLTLAFADVTGLDEGTLLRLSSSFGGGMGRLREVCGAVSGMFMVLGLVCGYATPQTGSVKAEHYAHVQQLAKAFEQKNGSIICRELLGRSRQDPTPDARTAQYYAERPCARLIGDAADILEAFLKQNSQEA